MRMVEANSLLSTEYDLWNKFVDDSPQGEVFCYSWWLKAVTKDDFKIIAVKENNQIVSGIILPFYGTGRINEPYLTRTTGVLYKKPGDESPRQRLSMERRWLNALLDAVDISQVVQMCMHHNFKDWLPFRWRGCEQTTRYTYILDYSATSIEAIWTNISQRQRRSVQKAVRNNLYIEEDDDMASVFAFSCLSFARQNKKFPYSLMDLQRLDDTVKTHGCRAILKVIDGDQRVHAVNYVVYNKKSAYHLLSGGDPRLRSLGGHTLLLWNTIQYFGDKVPVFNFGGSDLQPIEEHYRAFGGLQKQYFRIYNRDLVQYDENLKFHISKVLYHGKKILCDLKNRSKKKYIVLMCNMLRYLSRKIKRNA